MAVSKESAWWLEFYKDFRPVFGILPARSTSALAKRIVAELGLRPGSKFLDCPCGIGRLSIPLAKKGILVTGVDIMPSYLDEVQRIAKRSHVGVETVLKDMRRISFSNEFDAAGNIWTSFGYFEKESDNRLVLKNVFKALKPGGRFFMTLMNRDWVVTHFERTDWMEVGKVRLLEKRTFDFSRSASVSDWHFFTEGTERVHHTFIRMYSLHELLAMMRSVGFTDVEGYGSNPREEIDHNTRMMTLIGTKPFRKRTQRLKVHDSNEWWRASAPDFRPLFALATPGETKSQVSYLIKKLDLSRGSSFLDCGCGIGRLAIPLAARGVKVTGVDISPEYLKECQQTASRRKLRIKCIESDMRRINFDGAFDAVGNMWTSFGFFHKESDNILVLKKMFKALKPGGRFILSVTNRDWLLKHFTGTGWQDVGPLRVLQKRWFDYKRSASVADWHYVKEGRETTYRYYVRMYSYHEVRAALESIGFEDIEGYGSFQEERLSVDTRPMIVVARRPRR